jgi:hypothetical protein
MSRASVETVRTALRALDRRDVELYLSVASPEIELITPGGTPGGRKCRSRGDSRFFEDIREATASTGAD